MSHPIRWTVYVRAECSLCETLLTELAQMLGASGAQQVAVIDIDTDADLEQRYGRRVPVLLADDEFVCAYRLDGDRVRRYLAAG